MNYAHGTGHGVGSFLNVHEGPMGISWRAMPDDPGLVPNMFLSNGKNIRLKNESTYYLLFLIYTFDFSEPGYYENGEYGIRLEDIVKIVELVPAGNITKGIIIYRFNEKKYIEGNV